jgi:hypothetical protein
LKSANEFWSIAILVVGIAAFATTATVSTIRRNRGRRRPAAGADPVNWWSPSGPDGRHDGGHHGGHHGGWGGHHSGWGGGGDGGGGHHGGWSGGGDGGSTGGHHG